LAKEDVMADNLQGRARADAVEQALRSRRDKV
jgi:hypothetical protein